MKRMKKLARAVAFVVLMAFAALNLTGCDASAITGIIQKIIPVITQIIGAIKGVAGTAATTPATTATTASDTAVGTGTALAVTPVATSTAVVNQGDDGEAILNSDQE